VTPKRYPQWRLLRQLLGVFVRPAVQDVFDPRASNVIPEMYINRGLVELDLVRAAAESLHIVIFGNSGCGKTWLYKKVFKEAKIHYFTINLSEASTEKSLSKAIAATVDRAIGPSLRARRTSVGFRSFLTFSRTNETTTVDSKHTAYLRALQMCRKQAKQRPSFLVLENLELIFENRDLIRELCNLITLLDDHEFAKHNVKIALVGVPSLMITLTLGDLHFSWQDRF